MEVKLLSKKPCSFPFLSLKSTIYECQVIIKKTL